MLAPDKKGAEESGATLVFLDESGFSERPSVRRTWAPVGQTPIIRHHFNWKRLGAIGAIACKPDGSGARLLLHLEPGSIVKETIVEFLVALHQEIDGPVVLIWDGLPAHRSKIVKEHTDQQDWLTVERFPAYAPELNPVEYLWSSVKGKDVANLCSDALWQVEQKVRQAACRIESEPRIVKGSLLASKLYYERTLVRSCAESQ